MILLVHAALAADVGGFDAHGFTLAGHQGDPQGFLELATPSAGWRGAWDAGVVFDYAHNPLVEEVGEVSYPVLDQVLAANVVGGVSILGYARVDAVLPVYPFAVDQAGTFAGLGDLQLSGNVPVVTEKGLRPGFAVVPFVSAPTGSDTHFLGGAGFGFGGLLSLGQAIGPVRWVLNVGGRVGPTEIVRNVTAGSGVLGGLGVGYALGDAGLVGVEVHATSTYALDEGTLPLEALAHVRYRMPGGVYALAGGGAGLTSGIGSSAYRFVLGVGWSALGRQPDEDADHDGVVDRLDACPDAAEDPDGWKDDDGCPEPDNDGDHVPDASDKCPTDAEDFDGLEDTDGCPEDDVDGDAVPDLQDRCPTVPEDRDEDQDDDGCPEADLDRDRDGVPDFRDKCVDVPIRPGQDPSTSDGCPHLAEVTKDKIVITDKIFFQTGKAVILPESKPVLDAVVGVLQEHPELRDLLVEGHTDDVGDDDANYKLSEDRARAVVDWLVKAGVDRNRLAAKGYGETRPLVANDTDEHRAQNRRVEFTIVKR